jgi:hypothetical protein
MCGCVVDLAQADIKTVFALIEMPESGPARRLNLDEPVPELGAVVASLRRHHVHV